MNASSCSARTNSSLTIDDRYAEGLRLHLRNLEGLASNTVRLYPTLRCKGFLEVKKPRSP